MNRLSQEKSPYLLQHKENPVHWYAWGEDAFSAAREQSKPIFLSIGYSTCYWCHVMEKDSFELAEVAAVLNRDYISIKVDREERPDVDQIYMDAVVGLTGHGGWPMSVFLTPDLKPFWGGTFFYKAQFISILEQLAEAWKNDNQSVINSAEKITGFLKAHLKFDKTANLNPEILNAIKDVYKTNYEPDFGGFGNAPKFPPSMQLSFLLSEYFISKEPHLLDMTEHTLTSMYKGGLYDRLGGGFHRYSVDAKWLVPHFEKMLYDNALLSVAYMEAYQVTGNNVYLNVAKEVLNYIRDEMTSKEGGLFAAEDAGEVGKEGEFYVWTIEQLKDGLSNEEFDFVSSTFDVSEHGNFEHANILVLPQKAGTQPLYSEMFATIRKKLLEQRSKRERPHRDEKIITAWSSLAISSFAKLYAITLDNSYLLSAKNAAEFILEKLYVNNKLCRHYFQGNSSAEGVLEDYANFVEALINLGQVDPNPKWLDYAKRVQNVQDQLFWDEETGSYKASISPELIVNKQEFMDNAIPSGNSTSFLNLTRLSDMFYSEDWLNKADSLIEAFTPLITRYPSTFPKFAKAYRNRLEKRRQIVIVCDDINQGKMELQKLSSKYAPFDSVLLSLSENLSDPNLPEILKDKKTINSQPTFYICENHACQAPTHNLPV